MVFCILNPPTWERIYIYILACFILVVGVFRIIVWIKHTLILMHKFFYYREMKLEDKIKKLSETGSLTEEEFFIYLLLAFIFWSYLKLITPLISILFGLGFIDSLTVSTLIFLFLYFFFKE